MPSKFQIFKFLVISGFWLSLLFILLIGYYSIDLPDVSKIDEDVRKPSITLYDQNNKVIATMGDLYGDYIKFKEFPKTLIDAVLATEDRRFFDHHGIDLYGLVRAFLTNLYKGHLVQGGSTITQQLAKNVYLSHERTLKRKIQELNLALYLEYKYTKEQILTMYLNRIYMGNGNYGVDAAAKSYFGKSARNVNLYESAILAGLLKAPSRYSPANNPDLARDRGYQVLLNMVDNESIPKTKLPKSGKLYYKFQQARSFTQNKAPFFTDWIREQLPDLIGQYTSGNIQIYTTLDLRMQQIAEQSLQKSLESNSKKHNVSQGAIVAMSKDGAILAMSGGKSYAESQFNRATQAYRQAGSAFKMFVYLAALENGYTPDSMVEDSPIKLKNWRPENYDNQYLGEVTLRDALAKSINTVSIKLAKDVGMNKIQDVAARLGITSKINNDLSAALGTSEVTLLELTGAYAHLANNGYSVWIHGVNKINVNGETVYAREKTGTAKILASDVVYKMNDMLMAVVQEGTGKNAIMPFDTAGKTGTTQNWRDAWFVGFTGDYVAGVWMGNDNNQPMGRVAGGSLPALVWKNFMTYAYKDRTPSNIARSGSIIEQIMSDRTAIQDNTGSISNKSQSENSVWEGIVNVFGNRKPVIIKPDSNQNQQNILYPEAAPDDATNIAPETDHNIDIDSKIFEIGPETLGIMEQEQPAIDNNGVSGQQQGVTGDSNSNSNNDKVDQQNNEAIDGAVIDIWPDPDKNDSNQNDLDNNTQQNVPAQ